MPLFQAFLQLVLKAEGIRSNPNCPPTTTTPTPQCPTAGQVWAARENGGGAGKLAGGGGGLFVVPGYSALWIPSGEL